MDKELIPIGKMASINHISIATLRLYDENGLLIPKYIDPDTGYRYYTLQQNSRLDLIAYMKELGMSLAEMKNVFEKEDITLIESILIEKNEQMYKDINEMKLRHDAIERSIKSIETYRKAPTPFILNIQYIDRRYAFKRPCSSNFYEYDLSEYEKNLAIFRRELMQNGFSYIHTYNVGTSISKDDVLNKRLKASDIFIFVESQIYKQRKDIKVIESGMYACIYIDRYEDEIEYARKLIAYCNENNYKITGDYICEVLTEFNIFDKTKRNMFLRLQIPIGF